MNSDVARKTIGALNAKPTQKRRVIATSSGLTSSSSVTVLGSSAMPQMGQEPGSCLTISGCMGQTYSVFTDGAAATIGSSAMPHLGQAPGCDWRASEAIGPGETAPACALCSSLFS